MVAIKIDDLYQEYVNHRKVELNKEQFVWIVNLFPALMVVLSDGIVDSEEWAEVKKLSSKLGKEFSSEDKGANQEVNLTTIYRTEFQFLLKNRDKWEVKFLNALKDYFEENKESKSFVLESMFLFAKASGGISTAEADTIEFLTKVLLID
ncbi:MAG: hypothetical protein M3421_02385 [Bacteroidota bacterium]|nr:hypothetical protein [Bacteroidota bacterium]